MKFSKKILTVLSCIALFATSAVFTSCKSDDDDENESLFAGKSYSASEIKMEVPEQTNEDGSKTKNIKMTISQSQLVLTGTLEKDGNSQKIEATYTKDSINTDGETTFNLSSVKLDSITVDAEDAGIEDSLTDGGFLQWKIKITDDKNGTITMGTNKSSFTYEVDTATKTVKATDSKGTTTINYADDGKTLTMNMTKDGTKITMTFTQN